MQLSTFPYTHAHANVNLQYMYLETREELTITMLCAKKGITFNQVRMPRCSEL